MREAWLLTVESIAESAARYAEKRKREARGSCERAYWQGRADMARALLVFMRAERTNGHKRRQVRPVVFEVVVERQEVRE